MYWGVKNSIALGITIFLVWLLLSQIDLNSFRSLQVSINPWWLLLGGVWYGIAYLWRAARFQKLLSQFPESAIQLLSITAIHNLAVRIFPNPMGELVFLQQTRQRGIPSAVGAATVVVSRGLDFFVVSTVLLLGTLFLLYSDIGFSVLYAFVAGAILVGEIILFILLSLRPAIFQRALTELGNLLPRRFTAKISNAESQFLNAIGSLDRKIYLQALAYSLFLWSSMFAAYAFFLHGFGISISFIALMLGGSVQIIANAIPNIGGFGVMEAGWVAGFSLVGIPLAISIPAAFAVDIMTLVGTILFGLLGIAFQRGIFIQSSVRT